jgi:hypothetical protein
MRNVPSCPPAIRLASSRQLWRLNQHGRLRIVDEDGDPLTVADADTALCTVLTEAYPGLSRFPRLGEPYRLPR